MMLLAQNLKKSFDDRELFSEISLSIPEGKKIAITGRSGSGKTTLLNILGLIESSDEGKLQIEGNLVDQNSNKVRNQKIGFIFQFHYLNPDLTVFENLELPRLIQGKRLTRQEALELLKKVHLEDKLEAPAKILSGGQKQRVAFARALVNQPKLILADEPTGQLDPSMALEMMGILTSLPQAVVLVTHDRQFAMKMEERYELENQRLVAW
ncbi:MAG: ABC transporter ATP-binding protein [Chlamydiae bacterium]|nr:ABC transporter ATP-binding protein [Chlamydiota bacterium]